MISQSIGAIRETLNLDVWCYAGRTLQAALSAVPVLSTGPLVALPPTPPAWVLRRPSARSGSVGVVEEQFTLGPCAPPEPGGLEGVELLDDSPGQLRAHGRVAPDQLPSRHPAGHRQLQVGVAPGREGIQLGTVDGLVGEDGLGDVGRRSLQPA